jgi:hypothetical protein
VRIRALFVPGRAARATGICDGAIPRASTRHNSTCGSGTLTRPGPHRRNGGRPRSTVRNIAASRPEVDGVQQAGRSPRRATVLAEGEDAPKAQVAPGFSGLPEAGVAFGRLRALFVPGRAAGSTVICDGAIPRASTRCKDDVRLRDADAPRSAPSNWWSTPKHSAERHRTCEGRAGEHVGLEYGFVQRSDELVLRRGRAIRTFFSHDCREALKQP